jgi:predicted DNA-binding transcriptional regulator YafY
MFSPSLFSLRGQTWTRLAHRLSLVRSKYRRADVERFAGMFHQTLVGVSDYTQKAEMIDQIMLGIEDKRAVFITYQSLQATEPVTYDVYPYGLACHRGSLYLVGFAPEHRQMRHWKVDRIEEAEVTPVPFNRPANFDLQQHFAKSFGVFHGDGEVHVRVRFSPSVARYVSELSWHSSQRLTPQKDGGVVAEFDLNNTEEIKRWVQSFGKHAVVLEPEPLRKEIFEELEALHELYGLSGRAPQRSTTRADIQGTAPDAIPAKISRRHRQKEMKG